MLITEAVIAREMKAYSNNHACIFACFNCKIARRIFMKFRMNVTPFQAIPKPQFSAFGILMVVAMESACLPGYDAV
jgi:hypothetical protein